MQLLCENIWNNIGNKWQTMRWFCRHSHDIIISFAFNSHCAHSHTHTYTANDFVQWIWFRRNNKFYCALLDIFAKKSIIIVLEYDVKMHVYISNCNAFNLCAQFASHSETKNVFFLFIKQHSLTLWHTHTQIRIKQSTIHFQIGINRWNFATVCFYFRWAFIQTIKSR